MIEGVTFFLRVKGLEETPISGPESVSLCASSRKLNLPRSQWRTLGSPTHTVVVGGLRRSKS